MLHLIEGANSYEVIATNSCGSTSQMTVIIYEEELPCYEPTISFINPASSPFEYLGKIGSTSFTANIGNVSSQNMISVNLNGTAISCAFDALSGNISGVISLIEGNNTISISATNECGNTTAETVITYGGIQNQLPPPIVSIRIMIRRSSSLAVYPCHRRSSPPLQLPPVVHNVAVILL